MRQGSKGILGRRNGRRKGIEAEEVVNYTGEEYNIPNGEGYRNEDKR